MFGGIVETVGVVKTVSEDGGCKHLTIAPGLLFDDLRIGDSVAVNGVCLTVTRLAENGFACSAVPETLALSNIGRLAAGSLVNLERALKADARIGGHYVQGHVDGLGELSELQHEGAALVATVKVPAALTKYIVKKGYVTVDGMSLTVVAVGPEQFTVTLIPHTQVVTVVKQYRPGSQLNIEVDILGKYAEKLLGVKQQ